MARPLSQSARTKMLESAAQVALDVGVHRFNIDEVSKRAGVARTTINRHFPTKNQLLVEALNGLIPEPVTPDTGSLRDDLIAFLSSVLPIFANQQVRALFLDILAAANREPELMALQQSMMQGRSVPTKAIFDRGQARGEIADHFDYEEAFVLFEAPLVMRGLGPPGSLDDFDLEKHVDQVLFVLGNQPARVSD